MPIHDLIVHRANTLLDQADPFAQVEAIIAKGFFHLEVDIYITSEATFKFCHPVGAENITTEFDANSTALANFVTRYPAVQWWIDPKCLDVPTPPLPLLWSIFSAFNPSRDIVTARHTEVLQLAHKMGFKTCMYRDDHKERSFVIDYYSQEIDEPLVYPRDKTFVYCRDPESVKTAIGFAGVMIDGKYLF